MIISSILLYLVPSVCADDRIRKAVHFSCTHSQYAKNAHVAIGVSIGETVIATAFQANSSDQPSTLR